MVANYNEQQEQAPALKKADRHVLCTLMKFDRSILSSPDKVADEMDEDVRLSARTIGPTIRRLVELGLAERPEGANNGARLTNKGRQLASKIAE